MITIQLKIIYQPSAPKKPILSIESTTHLHIPIVNLPIPLPVIFRKNKAPDSNFHNRINGQNRSCTGAFTDIVLHQKLIDIAHQSVQYPKPSSKSVSFSSYP